MLAFLFVVPFHHVKRGFYRLIVLLSLLSAAFALLSQQQYVMNATELIDLSKRDVTVWSMRSFVFMIGFCLFLIYYLFAFGFGRKELVGRSVLLPAMSFGFAALICKSMAFQVADRSGIWYEVLWPSNFVISALVLGAAMVAMLLGHWYLVIHDLSIEPMKRISVVLILVLLVRLIAVTTTAVIFWLRNELWRTPLTNALFYNPKLFFWQGIIFGILGPLILSWMVWHTVNIRSTQSATGILYAVIVFVLVGDMTFKHFFAITGIPL